MPTSPLQAGVGRTDITPPLGTYLCGYALEGRNAVAINDPLQSTALVIAGADTQVALVSLDWVMIEAVDVETIRQAAHARTGIPPANITIATTHTHTGPATMTLGGFGEKNHDYVRASIPRIVDAIAQGHAALQPVRFGAGSGPSDVGVNRRPIQEDHSVGLSYNPWGLYDPAMTVLRFEGERGTVATVIHYGAHPTALGIVDFVSRDWPGFLLDRVETITKAPALFINGALGDIAPRTSKRHCTGDSLPAATEVGLRAAHHALEIFHGIRDLRCEAALRTWTEEVLLPYAPLPSLEEAEREWKAAAEKPTVWGPDAANRRYWEGVVAAHAAEIRPGLKFQQTLTALGPVALVPFMGEPFTEIILRLRDLSPFQYTLGASVTNGQHGYYVTREARVRGGYEVWVARALGTYIPADNIDDVLVQENVRLLRTLFER